MPKLTKRYIDQVKPPSREGQGIYDLHWDEDLHGFGLRVLKSGTKTYILQYNFEGESRRMTLGRHGVLTPDEARKSARVLLGKVAAGGDPAKEKKDRRAQPTMSDLAADYLEHHAKPHKAPRSVQGDRSMLNKIVLPKLGRKKVVDVKPQDIEALMRALSDTPYRANRVRALMSKMFNLAIVWQWRTDNPTQFTKKYPEEKRVRWLAPDEIARLRKVLDEHTNRRAVNAISLLLLTGARRNEVFQAKWDQFDLKRGVWSKPAHTTKQRKLHHLPLSDGALELLRELRADAHHNDIYVFPGDKPGKPLHDIKKAWREILDAAGIENFHLHDLRHTFASNLVSVGESLPIVGGLLGHTQAQTTLRYAHLADDALRLATNKMGDIYERSVSRKADDKG